MNTKLAKKSISVLLSFALIISCFNPAVIKAYAVEGETGAQPALAEQTNPNDQSGSSGQSENQGQSASSGEETQIMPLAETPADTPAFVDTENIKKTANQDSEYFASVDGHFFCDGETDMEFHYRDEFFYGSSTKYNPSLATMTANMCWAGFNWVGNNSEGHDYSYGFKRLQELTEQCGFSNFEANAYYKKIPEAFSIGIGIASKQITLPDGSKRTLITVTQRSGNYGSEWSSNTTLGPEGEAEGFARGRNEVIECLIAYMNKYEDEIGASPKIWISGYSRGSAIGNLTGNFIDCAIEGAACDSPLMGTELMAEFRSVVNTFNLQKEDVYCYGIEVPKGGIEEYEANDTSNLHVCLDPNDPVPYVAPSQWNFKQYGKIHYITDHNDANGNGEFDYKNTTSYGGRDYINALTKFDANLAYQYQNNQMSSDFQPYEAPTVVALFSPSDYKEVSESESKVGANFGEFTHNLLGELTSTCGARTDYNDSLQKALAVLSKAMMNPETGNKAMKALIDSAWTNRSIFRLVAEGTGAAMFVTPGWTVTAYMLCAAAYFIPVVGPIIGTAGMAFLTVEAVMNDELAEDLLYTIVDDIYKEGAIDKDDRDQLRKAIPGLYPILRDFLQRDNMNDFRYVATIIRYGGDLATFHMPAYVTTHLRMQDPLYTYADTNSYYRLNVMPDEADQQFSADTTVDIINVADDGTRTLLARVNNGTISYTSAGSSLQGKIKAVQYEGASNGASTTGMMNIDVVGDDIPKLQFEVSAPDASGSRSAYVPLRVTYDYFKPGTENQQKRQDFENEGLYFDAGNKLTLTCTKDNKACVAEWTCAVTPHFVDKDFNEIDSSCDVVANMVGGNAEGERALNSIPEDSYAFLSAPNPPEGYDYCDLTFDHQRDSNRKYTALSDSVPVNFDHRAHSRDLYVVCFTQSEAQPLKLNIIQSSIENGTVKTADISQQVWDYESFNMGTGGAITGDNGSSEVQRYKLQDALYKDSDIKFARGDRVTVQIHSAVLHTRVNNDGIIAMESWLVEGWHADDPTIQQTIDIDPGNNMTKIEFVMPDYPVTLNCVVREYTSDKTITFTGMLDATTVEDGNTVSIDPEQAGFELIASDCIDDSVSASTLHKKGYVTKTYKLDQSKVASEYQESSNAGTLNAKITAPDLPSSLTRTCAFDKWEGYEEDEYFIRSSTQAKDRDIDFPLTPAFLSSFAQQVKSMRVVPTYKIPEYSFTYTAPNFNDNEDTVLWRKEGASVSTAFKPDTDQIDEQFYSYVASEGTLNEPVVTYRPITEQVDGDGNVFHVEGDEQPYYGYSFVSVDGGDITQGTCAKGYVNAVMPQGNVTVFESVKSNKRDLYLQMNDDEPELILSTLPGALSVGLPYKDKLKDGEQINSIETYPANVPYTLDENEGKVVLSKTPAEDLTVTLRTSSPRTLHVEGGKVFLDGKETAEVPIDDQGNYRIMSHSYVMVKPDLGAVPLTQMFSDWNLSSWKPDKSNEQLALKQISDGTLFFPMPEADMGLAAQYVDKKVIYGGSYVLSSDLTPGSSLPYGAITADEGFKNKTVDVSWVPTYGSDTALVRNNVGYTATITVEPEDKCAFPSDMSKMVFYVTAGDKTIRCLSADNSERVDGDGTLVLNSDGTVTAKCTFTVPALKITSVTGQGVLEGLANSLTRDDAAKYVEENISKVAEVSLADGRSYNLPVVWNIDAFKNSYDPEKTESQTFEMTGAVQLTPSGNASTPFEATGDFRNYEFNEGVSATITCSITTKEASQPDPQPEVGELASPTTTPSWGAYIVDLEEDPEGLKVELTGPWSKDDVTIKYRVDETIYGKPGITEEYTEPIMLKPEGDAAKVYVISCYAIAKRNIQSGDSVIPAGSESFVTCHRFSISASEPESKTVQLTVVDDTGSSEYTYGSGTYVVGQRVLVSVSNLPEGCSLKKWTSAPAGCVSSGQEGNASCEIIVPANDVTLTANLHWDTQVQLDGAGSYYSSAAIELAQADPSVPHVIRIIEPSSNPDSSSDFMDLVEKIGQLKDSNVDVSLEVPTSSGIARFDKTAVLEMADLVATGGSKLHLIIEDTTVEAGFSPDVVKVYTIWLADENNNVVDTRFNSGKAFLTVGAPESASEGQTVHVTCITGSPEDEFIDRSAAKEDGTVTFMTTHFSDFKLALVDDSSDDPSTPSDPGTPSDPSNPGTPGASDDKSGSGTSDDSNALGGSGAGGSSNLTTTGDTTNAIPWLMLLGLSAAALVGLVVFRKASTPKSTVKGKHQR